MSSNPVEAPAHSIDKQAFCRTCARFATGITITSVIGADGAPHGMTANSFTSVSLDPPLVLVCVDHRARILDHFRVAAHFGINILEERQRALSVHFARSGYDRFDGVDWYPGKTGVPLLPGVLSTLECAVRQVVDVGDHAVLVGEVLYGTCGDGRPLVYFSSNYRKLADEEHR
jgi:flavin reductase (DIM6/NTAB) family NADH-FMN oxidoreductase RutF